MTTHNVRAGGNCLRFTDAATEVLGVDVEYLPNLIPLGEHWPRPRHAWAAACELAHALRVPTELNVTADRDDGGTYRAIEELCDGVPNIELTRIGWLRWPRLLRLTEHMHLVLQPSFTESFNCVAEEAVRMGVPVAGAESIDWLPRRWQAEADDASDLARVAEYLIKSPHAVEDGRRALQQHVVLGLERWRGFVSGTAQSARPASDQPSS